MAQYSTVRGFTRLSSSLRVLVFGLGLAMTIGLVTALPSLAEPATDTSTSAATEPATADDAKTAWIEAAHASEALNEAVLQAQVDVDTADAAVIAAQTLIDPTLAEVATADAAVVAADAEVANYKVKLDAFANASLRGARLSQLSTLLTADSPEDYLEEASALNRVAGDAKDTMAKAAEAKTAADTAKLTAEAARDAAAQAALDAQAAKDASVAAQADLIAQQASMEEQIKIYEKLYSSLTLSERVAAVSGYENANASGAASAVHAQQAADRAAAGITDESIDTTDLAALAVDLAPDTAAGIAVSAALTRQGLPYVWGAVGPDAFDCSGLMLWAWEQAGITIPRVSAAQAGLPTVPLAELQPGDLVTYYSPVTHVGMYVGMGLVLHASMPGVPIKVVDLYKAGPNPTGHRVQR